MFRHHPYPCRLNGALNNAECGKHVSLAREVAAEDPTRDVHPMLVASSPSSTYLMLVSSLSLCPFGLGSLKNLCHCAQNVLLIIWM